MLPALSLALRPLLALALLISFAVPLHAAEQYPEWREVFDVYAEDPNAAAEQVIELGKKGIDGYPPSVPTVLGDAYLRQGNYGAARRMFLRVLQDPSAGSQMGPGKAPIASHAELGLALSAVGAGKLADAREWFAKASAAGGDLGYLATLGHAQTAIALGRHDEGLEILEAMSEAEGVEDALVEASRFAAANALLDGGDPAAAAEAFQSLADDSTGPNARDAAFAAAWARAKAGERDAAFEALTVLTEECPEREEGDEPRKVSRAERELDPTAVLQAWVRNYREQSFGMYDSGPAAALSLHGCDLAVETVAVFEEVVPVAAVAPVEEPAPPSPAEEVLPVAGDAGGSAPAAGEEASKAASTEASPTVADEGRMSPWIVFVIVAVIGVLVFVWRRG